MINFYIDDSGTISMNDQTQQIFLFSALCIPGAIYIDIKNEMDKLLHDMKEDIKNKLITICTGGECSKATSTGLANYFLELIIKDNFEIHCSEIIRGDKIYMLFESYDREKYLINVLNVIKKYDIKILSVYCDKLEYKGIYNSLNPINLEKKKNSDMANCLIGQLEEHLNLYEEQGCIIIDEGNLIINTVVNPKLQSGEIALKNENLNRDIKQVKSHEYSLIQMADVAAYITNFKLSINKKVELGIKVSKKNKTRSKKFYDIIESNNLIINILPEEDLREEELEEKLVEII